MKRTALKRKRATPRRYKTPRCIYATPTGRQTCKKPQEHIGRCVTHAKWYLHGLAREALRTDSCQIDHALLARVTGTLVRCGGPLQVLHGIDRDELGVTWDLRNLFWGDAGTNTWGSKNRRRWYAYVREVRGAETYAELERLADGVNRGNVKVDYGAVERVLRDALQQKAKELKA